MRQYWLKMFGAADDPLDKNWTQQDPEMLSKARFSKCPSGIQRDDLLVCYAPGEQVIFGIAIASRPGANAEHKPRAIDDRWPWALACPIVLAIPNLARAPGWSVLGIQPESVKQHSHISITRARYELAWNAITQATRSD